ncbi:insulinase (Peptidase family M16) protein [Artemisia annua]|uniref:Insulinase (Peptidase family M16) protein n=1 Tax=Artemisia annua TaxID=35608 RepID=A0A2U1L8N6_ARTAN|nr:insulinase (Peptidase family M16) protein [Artemisia annua]
MGLEAPYALESSKSCNINERCNNSNGPLTRSWAWRRPLRSGLEMEQLVGLTNLLLTFDITNCPDSWICSIENNKPYRISAMRKDLPNLITWGDTASLQQSLKLDMEEVLSGNPYDTDFGKLANGLTYYVKVNDRPRMRAHLVLAVRAGCVLEEEGEEGVAHIIEHLAFSATSSFQKHEIIKFLTSVGLQFGACQNAETTVDGTFYKLIVPIDNTETLSKAISILSEFSSEIRISAEDLDNERYPILQEYRDSKDIEGRMSDALLGILFEDSKYQRSPIGLVEVIEKVTPETVKQFYSKWYNFHNIAVIAVGDFPNTETVVDMIKTHFDSKVSSAVKADIPRFLVPTHQTPRFKCFVDSEASMPSVKICFKTPMNESQMTVKDYRNTVVESMFWQAMKRRFHNISQKIDRPYFSCKIEACLFAKPVKVHVLTSECKEDGILLALEAMLTELARVRLHRFSDQETSLARKLLVSKLESAYLQRDQTESVHFQEDLIKHFIHDEPVISIQREIELRRKILRDMSASEISEYSKKLHTAVNCVIMTTQHRDGVTVRDLEAVVLKINSLEENKRISSWYEEPIPEEIVTTKPQPGTTKSFRSITLLLVLNVVFSGFAYGGLSEVPESDYLSCRLASQIAGQIGILGYKQSMLKDILIGNSAVVGAFIDSYTRTFNGSCSPTDLETALQLVYNLFVTRVIPKDEDIKMVMEMTEHAFRVQEKDQMAVFESLVKEYTYGRSHFSRPKRVNDLENVNLHKACDFFNDCYTDPSNFTVVIVGNLVPDVAIPLILKYLAGIPRPSSPVMKFSRDELKPLPYAFPTETVREVVRFPMVEESSTVKLCFPLLLKNVEMREYDRFIALWKNLLLTRLYEVLRFELGEVYECDVIVNDVANMPSYVGGFCGHLTVEFSCEPEATQSLVDATLEEVQRLQDEGPLTKELEAALEIDWRESETDLQKNGWWHEQILASYQSSIYSGDVGVSFNAAENRDLTFRNNLTPEVARTALRKLIPYPCKNWYTLVTLMPEDNSVEDSE